jgi:hypothetical protein
VIGQRVGNTDRVRGCHTLKRFLGVNPLNRDRLIRGRGLTVNRTATKYESNDAPRKVLVRTGQPLDVDRDSSLFENLSTHALIKRFAKLKDATGRLPVLIVAALNHKNAPFGIDDDARDADGMLRRAAHVNPPGLRQ